MHWTVEVGTNLDGLEKCVQYKDQKSRWHRRHSSHMRSKGEVQREGMTLFVQKFCPKLIEKVAQEHDIGAKQAVGQIVEEWERRGKRPTTDAGMELKGRRLGLLKPKMKEGLNNVEASEWVKVRFCVDSGAGETVML